MVRTEGLDVRLEIVGFLVLYRLVRAVHGHAGVPVLNHRFHLADLGGPATSDETCSAPARWGKYHGAHRRDDGASERGSSVRAPAQTGMASRTTFLRDGQQTRVEAEGGCGDSLFLGEGGSEIEGSNTCRQSSGE
jgi:hypothetical protein